MKILLLSFLLAVAFEESYGCYSFSDCPKTSGSSDKNFCCYDNTCCTANTYLGYECLRDTDCSNPPKSYCCQNETCCTAKDFVPCTNSSQCPGLGDSSLLTHCCGSRCCAEWEYTLHKTVPCSSDDYCRYWNVDKPYCCSDRVCCTPKRHFGFECVTIEGCSEGYYCDLTHHKCSLYKSANANCSSGSDCPRAMDSKDEMFCCADGECCTYDQYHGFECSADVDCNNESKPYCCLDDRKCCTDKEFNGLGCLSNSDCPGQSDSFDKNYCCTDNTCCTHTDFYGYECSADDDCTSGAKFFCCVNHKKCCTHNALAGLCSSNQDCPGELDSLGKDYCCENDTCCTEKEFYGCRSNSDCPGESDSTDEKYCCANNTCCTHTEFYGYECSEDDDCTNGTKSYCCKDHGKCCSYDELIGRENPGIQNPGIQNPECLDSLQCLNLSKPVCCKKEGKCCSYPEYFATFNASADIKCLKNEDCVDRPKFYCCLDSRECCSYQEFTRHGCLTDLDCSDYIDIGKDHCCLNRECCTSNEYNGYECTFDNDCPGGMHCREHICIEHISYFLTNEAIIGILVAVVSVVIIIVSIALSRNREFVTVGIKSLAKTMKPSALSQSAKAKGVASATSTLPGHSVLISEKPDQEISISAPTISPAI